MRVMSTLKTVWTCALMCFDSGMRCAMMARTRRVRSLPW